MADFGAGALHFNSMRSDQSISHQSYITIKTKYTKKVALLVFFLPTAYFPYTKLYYIIHINFIFIKFTRIVTFLQNTHQPAFPFQFLKEKVTTSFTQEKKSSKISDSQGAHLPLEIWVYPILYVWDNVYYIIHRI